MRIKALLALLGVILALVLVTGCSNNDDDNHFVGQVANFDVTVCDVTNNTAASGAVVDLVNTTSGNVVESATTNENGVATFTNVPLCSTAFVLRTTFNGATVTSEPFVITSTAPVFPTIFVNSAPNTATFTVAVIDLNDNPVSGATVNLLQGGNAVPGFSPVVTGDNGFATFTNVPFGADYSLLVTGASFPNATKGPCAINELTPSFCTVQVDTTIPQETATISGTISGLPSSSPITAALYLNGIFVPDSTQTISDITANSTASFSFSGLQKRTGSFTIVVTSPTGEFPETTYGPITIGDVDVTGLDIPIVTTDVITNTFGVPTTDLGSLDTSTIVVFPPLASPTSTVPFSIVDISGTSLPGNDGVQYFTGVSAAAPIILNGTLDTSTFQLSIIPVPGEYTVVRYSDTMITGTTIATTKKAKK